VVALEEHGELAFMYIVADTDRMQGEITSSPDAAAMSLAFYTRILLLKTPVGHECILVKKKSL
jgi:hypothetical protein